jgi:hypothetical protein
MYYMEAEVIRYKGVATPGQLIKLGRYTTLATGGDALVIRWVRRDGEGKRPLSKLCEELGLKVGDVV